MEAMRQRLIANPIPGTDSGFVTATSSPRSTVPLPRRNTTPAQRPSQKSPSHAQHRPTGPLAPTPLKASSSTPQAASAAPVARAASPARTGEKPSTLHMTCKDWDVQDMLKTHSNFRPVRRISALVPPDELLRELTEYENSGLPLIIEDWHKHPKWQGELLGMEWLLANLGDKEIPVRNVHDRRDTTMKMSQFIEASRTQDVHYVSGETSRYYWKDGECPSQWKDWLQGVLPTPILPGSRDDLLRHLRPSEAVETLLCYLGAGDTYTPAHKDLCASSGHNLMCFSEHGGSSFWFMTASTAAAEVAEYFQKELGQELDWETHVTTVEEWGNANFNVHVAEQRVGDLVLVPSRSVHQVVNRGGLAMKLSWSRMSLNNLKTALRRELPIYRRVCRPEQYRVKTILYRSMLHNMDELRSALDDEQGSNSNKSSTRLVDYSSSMESAGDNSTPWMQLPDTKEQLAIKLSRHIGLFDDVLQQEYASCHDKLEHIARSDAPEKNGSDHKVSYNLACDFCGADIFQSFFECQRCRADDDEHAQIGDGLLVCPACYVEGRTCSCDQMHPRQCRPFSVLLQDRNEAASVLARAPVSTTKRGKGTSPLKEQHFRDREKVRIFEAACALWDMKVNRTAGKNNIRRCRVRTHCRENHDIPPIAGLGCTMCHAAKCYFHLLSIGTHCAEALLASRVSDEYYHEMHKNNLAMTRQRPPALYDVDGANIQDGLLVAAKSFPRCKPGHPKLQLGWYDNEPEVANSVVDAEAPHPAEPSSHTIDREDSPLTPLSSPAKDSDSPSSLPSGSRSTARDLKASSPTGKDDDSVISINSDSDDQQDHAPVMHSSSPAKRKQNRAYVELTSLASLRRTSSPASIDLEPRSKKPRLDRSHQDVDTNTSNKSGGLRTSVGDKPVGKRPLGHIRESYSNDLASVLTQAHAATPIFTQPTLPVRSKTQHQGALRRIISPDPEESTPHISTDPSKPPPRLSSGVPAISKAPLLPRGPSTSVSPGADFIAPSQSHHHEHDVTATATKPAEDAPALVSPRKRKRTGGPPGVPREKFQAYLDRRKRAREEATEAGNTTGLQEDVEEDVEVDDTPKRVGHPPSTPRIAHTPSKDTPSVPGPIEAPPPPPHPTTPSSSVPASTRTRTSALSEPLRALADSIDSHPDFLRPLANPELEQAMQRLQDEIKVLREELQAAQSRDEELERRVKTLEDEKARLQETLLKEREERGLAARTVRALDDRTGRLERERVSLPHDAIERYVRETVKSLMPNFQSQFQELATNAVREVIGSGSVNIVQTTLALHTAQPTSVPLHHQLESGKPIPQGPAGHPHPNLRQYGRGGSQRNYGPRPQDQYHNGNRDGRSDRGHFQAGPAYRGSSHHGGFRDDGRQSHPRPVSSGSHSSGEGHPPNFNNWSRRQGAWENDYKSRRGDSPRRDHDRSRSPDRRKDREPTLDYIDPEPTMRLREANWEMNISSSIQQFDDVDDVRAVGGSSTDPELSPIETCSEKSPKSPLHSEIQESSFTERDAGSEAPKPPSGPRGSRQTPRSPVRGRPKSRPIRQ